MSSIKELCQGKWKSLLPMFGVPSGALSGKHQSCPLCPGDGGKDRFRFDDNKGLGTFFCSQCGAGSGIDFLMKFKGWDFKHTADELEKVVGKAERKVSEVKHDEGKIRDWMRQIWESRKPIDRFDPVGKYLAGRGFLPAEYPSTLGYVEKCYYEKGVYLPAMVAIFQGPDGVAGQLHRTFLTFDGQKADVETVRKQMPLAFPDGGAVRLGQVGVALGIAEGIETALAASQMFGMPVWAALNKTLLMKWELPEGVEEVFVYSDNDENYAGQSCAFNLASKLKHRNPDLLVHVCVPKRVGTDWNDELLSNVKIVA